MTGKSKATDGTPASESDQAGSYQSVEEYNRIAGARAALPPPTGAEKQTDAEIGEQFRARCKELHQKLGRDAMLRQNDPVETITEFAWCVWQEGYAEGYHSDAYKQGYADASAPQVEPAEGEALPWDIANLIEEYQNLVKTGAEYATSELRLAPTSAFEIYMGHFRDIGRDIITALTSQSAELLSLRRKIGKAPKAAAPHQSGESGNG